jgi:hypothetical protein
MGRNALILSGLDVFNQPWLESAFTAPQFVSQFDEIRIMRSFPINLAAGLAAGEFIIEFFCLFLKNILYRFLVNLMQAAVADRADGKGTDPV